MPYRCSFVVGAALTSLMAIVAGCRSPATPSPSLAASPSKIVEPMCTPLASTPQLEIAALSIQSGHSGVLEEAAVISKDGLVATQGKDGVRLWSLKYRGLIRHLPKAGRPLAWTSRGDLVVEECREGAKGRRECTVQSIDVFGKAVATSTKIYGTRDSSMREGFRIARDALMAVEGQPPERRFLARVESGGYVWVSDDLARVEPHWFGAKDAEACNDVRVSFDGKVVACVTDLSASGPQPELGVKRTIRASVFRERDGKPEQVFTREVQGTFYINVLSGVFLDPGGNWLQVAMTNDPWLEWRWEFSREARPDNKGGEATPYIGLATDPRTRRELPESFWTAMDGTRYTATVSAQDGSVLVQSVPRDWSDAEPVEEYSLGFPRLGATVSFDDADTLRVSDSLTWDLRTATAVPKAHSSAGPSAREDVCETEAEREHRLSNGKGERIGLLSGRIEDTIHSGGAVLRMVHAWKDIPTGPAPSGWSMAPPGLQKFGYFSQKTYMFEESAVDGKRVCQRRITMLSPPACSPKELVAEPCSTPIRSVPRALGKTWFVLGGNILDHTGRTVGKSPFPPTPTMVIVDMPSSAFGERYCSGDCFFDFTLQQTDTSAADIVAAATGRNSSGSVQRRVGDGGNGSRPPTGNNKSAAALPGVGAVHTSPKDDLLVWVDADGSTAHVHELPSGAPRAKHSATPGTRITSVVVLDAKELLLAESDGTLRRIVDSKEVARIKSPSPLGRLLLSPKGDLLLATSADGVTRVYSRVDLSELAHATVDIPGDPVFSPRSEWLAGVGSDGLARVYSTKDLRELAAFVSFADDEHLAFTPAGAYSGSPEAAGRVGLVFGARQLASFEQFDSVYNRPDVVVGRLNGTLADLDGRPNAPPDLDLTAPPRVEGSTARISVRASSRRQVAYLQAYVEGRAVGEPRRPCAPSATVELQVPLGPGRQRVTVTAFDDRGFAATPIEVDVDSEANAPNRVTREPSLWIVSVGVSQYQHLPPDLQLDLADDDARAIADTLSSRAVATETYSSVHPAVVLTDAAATPKAIRAALDGLAEMKPEDVAVVFLAGHGFKSSAGADMVFATGSVHLESGPLGATVPAASITNDTVSWADIGQSLRKARGRVLVLLDACHSGHVAQGVVAPNDALARSLTLEHRSGAIVFAAAKGRQESYEPGGARGFTLKADGAKLVESDVPHGFFTAAILKSLATGAGDKNHDGLLHMSELIAETTHRVHTATGGKQTPWVARRELFGDFALLRTHK